MRIEREMIKIVVEKREEETVKKKMRRNKDGKRK